MSLSDFLFNGAPPPSVTTYGQSVDQLPAWLSDYTQGLISKANAVAANPYPLYQGPRVAGFTPQQQQSFQMASSNVGDWQSGLNQAGNTVQGGLTQAQGALGQAQNLYGASLDPRYSTLRAAAPYLQQASQTFPQAAQQYMDPYVQNVIDRGTQVAMRNYNEKVLPGLNDQFIRSGQYGSSAHQREADRAARDLTEGVQSQAQGALSQAYQSAGSLFGADASRAGQLAATAGQLTDADRQALTQAASGLTSAGSTAGNLGISAGKSMADMASQQQQQGLTDVNTLSTAGQQQQQQGQQNLDLAYNDFMNQAQYPQQQLQWLSSIIRGTPYDTSQTRTNVAPLPGAKYGSTGLQDIGALSDIYNSVKSSAKGGLQQAFAEGGPVEGGDSSLDPRDAHNFVHQLHHMGLLTDDELAEIRAELHGHGASHRGGALAMAGY